MSADALVRTPPTPMHLGNLRAALLRALDRQRAKEGATA